MFETWRSSQLGCLLNFQPLLFGLQLLCLGINLLLADLPAHSPCMKRYWQAHGQSGHHCHLPNTQQAQFIKSSLCKALNASRFVGHCLCGLHRSLPSFQAVAKSVMHLHARHSGVSECGIWSTRLPPSIHALAALQSIARTSKCWLAKS